MKVSCYIHVPTGLSVGKAAVYKARETVPQVQSADEKEESHSLHVPFHLKLELPPPQITCCASRWYAEIRYLLCSESKCVY
jgi:hypothetical protein